MNLLRDYLHKKVPRPFYQWGDQLQKLHDTLNRDVVDADYIIMLVIDAITQDTQSTKHARV